MRARPSPIYLPKAEGDASAHVAASIDDDAFPRGSETILLVEDEDILRELGGRSARQPRLSCHRRRDGSDAIAILEPVDLAPIDLVVTDLMMPRMNGRELIAWITENVGQMRVLFMSGYTDDEIIRDAVQGAEVEYLQKPFTPAALARKIREVLDRPSVLQAVPA